MQASDLLRQATATAHTAAETRLAAKSILDGSLSIADFADSIGAHYRAWSAVAAWWPEGPAVAPQAEGLFGTMLAALRRDLEVAELPSGTGPRLPLNAATVAIRYGALYVLRGSTLGGTMINRKLQACEALRALPAFHFHAACEALPGKEWPVFLRELNAAVQTESQLAEAVAGAKAVFNLYLLD